MPADPAPDCAILGFRQDRIGARIVCLLNVLRLSQDFDVTGRFVWLSEADGSYPELTDPHDFLDADFVERHMMIVTDRPDLSGRRNLTAEAPRMDHEHFASALRQGARFQTDAAFGILRMIDENAVLVRQRIAEIMAGLPLARPLVEALDHARTRLADHGDGKAPVAIHVRRGDLLDGLPWSLSSWPMKYVPDEFFRAWTATREGPVIAFSDTPDAVRHLAQGDPRIVPVGDLLAAAQLRPAQRDVLELMLMAECTHIGAPAGSAFSRAAEIVGTGRVDGLPGDLPYEARTAAYDALLARVIGRPGSFYATGDLAQSMQYAAAHAVNCGKAAAFIKACARREKINRAHPFVRRVLANTGFVAGDHDTALRQAKLALADERLQRRDRAQCQQIRMMVELETLPDDSPQIDAAFLNEIFVPQRRSGPAMPRLAARTLSRAGPASAAMLYPTEMLGALAAVKPAAEQVATGVKELPDWLYLMDWEELLPGDRARQPLRQTPDLPGKLRHIGGPGADIEAAMNAGEPAPAPGALDARLIGLYAAVLSLHGRYRRALKLLHWLDRQIPDDPLTLKRIADTCYRLGNLKAGNETLDRALGLVLDNPMFHLSKARRMAAMGQAQQARHHLSQADALWPDLSLIRQQDRLIERDLLAVQDVAPSH